MTERYTEETYMHKNLRAMLTPDAFAAMERAYDEHCMRTTPIPYRRSPWWKVALSRILLALSKAITCIEAGWRRLCKGLDAHPLVVLFLLVCCGGVAVLMAKMIRHMATGVW